MLCGIVKKLQKKIGSANCKFTNLPICRRSANLTQGETLHGGSLYFSFHRKWSKLGTHLQMDINEAEIKKKIKISDRAPS